MRQNSVEEHYLEHYLEQTWHVRIVSLSPNLSANKTENKRLQKEIN